MPVSSDKTNNFDLLRLVAAVQIASYHAMEHLHFDSPLLNRFIYFFRYFFGIHVLFAISGFLIYASYHRKPAPGEYTRNRILRVYPGLWACLLATILLLACTGYLPASSALSPQFWQWIAAQATCFQFYTPDILRPFGVHNPNGALWTIPVELCFYAFVPFLAWQSRKLRTGSNLLMIFWMALSIAFNIWYQPYKFSADRPAAIKLLGVSPAPYLFYFLLGSLAAHNWDRIKQWYEGKGMIWLATYAVYCLVCSHYLHLFHIGYWTNAWHFISVVLLSQATIALAYSARQAGVRLLRHNDLSFGIYIYHMPLINLFIVIGAGHNGWLFALLAAATGLLAWLSWRFVERPALSLKHRA